MKILYSQLKQLIPGLTATPTEVGEALTMIGLMQEELVAVNYNGQADSLISLEVRQNRADCFSVIGVAREVAAYFNLSLSPPEIKRWTPTDFILPIRVETDQVRRVRAIRLKNVKVKSSPVWLIDYLALYDIKSINWAVDLSNYVMILTGYTSHLINYQRLDGDIIWSINQRVQTITSLDQQPIKLTNGELVISDRQEIIALAGLVGTNYAMVESDTTDILLEMATYNPSLIRQNSRQLHVVTEASQRLSKDLSSTELEQAFDLLVNLLIDQLGAVPASQLFEYYPQPAESKVIEFNPQLVSQLAGVEIEPLISQRFLEQLGFTVNNQDVPWLVTVPTWRTDLSMAQDLVEEALRLYRFDKIPAILPALVVTPDITPLLVKAKEQWRDWLVANGWDEVLSWTMVTRQSNLDTNYLPWSIANTQNAINADYPDLRQTILASLVKQAQEYAKQQVPNLQIFEIGKVFGQTDGHYQEAEHLAWLMAGATTIVDDLRKIVTSFLQWTGLQQIEWIPLTELPSVANPYAGWQIVVNGQSLGLLMQLVETYHDQAMVAAEINVELLIDCLVNSELEPSTVELTQKLISLDANLELANRQELTAKLAEITAKIGSAGLWSLSVVDEFLLPNDRYRYTVRAVYQELDDQSAKKLHLQVFELN